MKKAEFPTLLRLFTVYLLFAGALWSPIAAAGSNPGVKYSQATEQQLEAVHSDLDACAKALEENGALYQSPGGEEMRTLTPPIRDCYVRAYEQAATVYDEAAMDLLDQAIAAGNLPKCKASAEKLTHDRPDFESVIRKLEEKPLGTDLEKLMATLYMNGSGIAVVSGGLGRVHMAGLACAMEAGP